MSVWSLEVSRAIAEGKWLSVQYNNKAGETTYFWCAITDVEPKTKRLICDVYNLKKSQEVLHEYNIMFDKIKKAQVLEGTTYEVPEALLRKLQNQFEDFKFLEIHGINERVLAYYNDCYVNDSEPYQQNIELIAGVDLETIQNEQPVTVDVFEKMVKAIQRTFKIKDTGTVKVVKLILNYLGIYSKKSGLIPIVYHEVLVNLETRTLTLKPNYEFVKRVISFDDENRFFLTNYLDCDYQYFIEHFHENEQFFIDQIAGNLAYGEKIDQMPFLYQIQSSLSMVIKDELASISQRYQMDDLNAPLKSFFGLTETERKKRKLKPILVENNHVNVNQLRVIHNALNRNVMFVQGPPGTGKTATIVNIILSCLYNDQSALVVSNNNEAIDNIYRKLLKIEYLGVSIRLPVLRLGNQSFMKAAFSSMYDFLLYAMHSHSHEKSDQRLKQISNQLKESFSKISGYIETYENQQEILSKIESLKTVIETIRLDAGMDEISKGLNVLAIEAEIQKLTVELGSDLIKDKDMTNILVDEGVVKEYLSFKSLSVIRSLLKPSNKQLKDIIESKSFDSFKEMMGTRSGMAQIIDCFPIIFSTNISCMKLGDKSTIFDLLIMEEASQCNVAVSLIPIARAHRACFIGDQNQLRPVIVLSEEKNELYKKSFDIPQAYCYRNNSILTTYLSVDSLSKFILLKKHYRCAKKIIDFSNKKYYGEELEIETKSKSIEPLKLIDVRNTVTNGRNTAVNEIDIVIDEVRKSSNQDEVAVITPFKNQEKLLRHSLDMHGFYDVKVGTIHTFQGDERDKIIVSSAITDETSQGAFDWVKNNHELINVMTTRPRDQLILISDTQRVSQLTRGEMNDYVELLTYMQYLGESEVTYNANEIFDSRTQGFRYYNSEAEQEFLQTISHLKSTNQQFTVATKVKITDILKLDMTDAKLFRYGNSSHFDFVLFDYQKKPLLAIEVMGPEHYNDEKVLARDKMKKEICARHHLKLFEVKNDYVRRYNDIKAGIIGVLRS